MVSASVPWPTEGEVIVLDTEFTSWPGARECEWSKPGMHRELVQMGAVRLDAARGYEIVDSFEVFVQPSINPVLSDYFIALTGITNAHIQADGVDTITALKGFARFVDQCPQIWAHGQDDLVLHENCDIHSFPWPFAQSRFVNLQRPMVRALGLGQVVSAAELPGLAGLSYQGQAHNALDDVTGVARVLQHLRQQGRI